MICSFTRHKEFNPSSSAIQVFKKGNLGIFFPIVSPYGGILLDIDGKPIYCDLCGGEPRCVEICPNKAIQIRKRGPRFVYKEE